MAKSKKPRVTQEPIPRHDVEKLLAWYFAHEDEGESADPADLDMSSIPIEIVKAVRLNLLNEVRELSAKAKDKERKPGLRYCDRRGARLHRVAAWRCQIEINRHNAFMRRQLAFVLPISDKGI